VPDKMSLSQFGQKIKTKYPQYGSMSDEEIGRKVLDKYPNYADSVDLTATKPPGFIANMRAQVAGVQGKMDASVAPGAKEDRHDFSGKLEQFATGIAQAGEAVLAHPIESFATGLLKQIRNVMPTYRNVGGIPVPVPNLKGTQELAEQGQFAIDHPAYVTGNFVGQAVLGATAGKTIKNFRRVATNNLRGTGQVIAGAGRGVVADEVRGAVRKGNETAQAASVKNRQAVEGHADSIREATRGNEEANMEHAYDTLEAQQEAAATHQEAVGRVRQQNKEAVDTHATEHQGVQELNQGAEQTLDLRRQTEADLKAKTDAYFTKEDATAASVKKATDQEWEPFHEKAKTPVDVDRLAGDLEKISARNSEAAGELRHITASAEDAAPDSLYAQDRAAIMQSQGYKGDYWELPAERRAKIDEIAASNGFEPEPIDFDPQKGVKTSLEDIHRATSIIGKNIADGKYEGVKLGEMKQVLKSLNAARTRGAIELGIAPELERGVKATREYMEAFGKERTPRRTVMGERKGDANADAVTERQEQARLDAAAKHDPSLVEDYKGVVAARAKLKAMPTEERLRAGLKPLPKPPVDTPDPRAPQVKLPDPPKMKGRPSNPELTPIEKPTVDTVALREEAIYKRARAWGFTGYDAAILTSSAILEPIVGQIMHVLGHGGGHSVVFRAGAASYVGGKAFAQKVLENPRVVKFLSQPPPGELAALRKIPGADGVTIISSISAIAKEAQAKGIPVSPAIAAFLAAGSVGNQPVQNRKEARDLLRPHFDIETGSTAPQ